MNTDQYVVIPLCNIAHYSYIIMIESVTYLFVVHGNGYNMNHFTDESLIMKTIVTMLEIGA